LIFYGSRFIFTERRYASVILCWSRVSVRLSVSLTRQAAIVPKWLNVRSRK